MFCQIHVLFRNVFFKITHQILVVVVGRERNQSGWLTERRTAIWWPWRRGWCVESISEHLEKIFNNFCVVCCLVDILKSVGPVSAGITRMIIQLLTSAEVGSRNRPLASIRSPIKRNPNCVSPSICPHGIAHKRRDVPRNTVACTFNTF